MATATAGDEDGEFERHRDAEGARKREVSSKARDIGPTPNIANVQRRARCRKSLKLFCETYNPRAVFWDWSADHLKAIARIEEAVTTGALYAYAMARGSGKSVLCRMAALWAMSYRLSRYPFIIGATDGKAREAIETLQKLIRFGEPYGLDFPEISFPANKLAGIANRAAGQMCGGEPTLIKWAADRIVLPRVPPPANVPKAWPLADGGVVPTAGSVVGASGLTGEGLRGSLETLATGEMIRPDLCLLDDPQTGESAGSPVQNEKRLKLIMGDVLGMAGPGAKISAVMPCTVIEPGDMIDQVLDRSKHPLWRGERSGILRAMPKNLDAWGRYFDVYARCAQLEPPDFGEANAHYVAHRAELDAGAEPSWPARKADDEVSAVQHAMHLYFRDRRAFWAEYMNRPEVDDKSLAASLDPAAVAAKVSNLPPGTLPHGTTRLTAFVDVGLSLLWYVVCAWDERFSGGPVAYGCYPEQSWAGFTGAEARVGLADLPEVRGLAIEAALFAGLTAVAANILGREYAVEGTGAGLRVARCLVDANYGPATDLVYEWCRRSPFSRVLYPSHGKFFGARSNPMSNWPDRTGEQRGPGWRLSAPTAARGRHVTFDTNHWKTFAADRLRTPPGPAGCWLLPAAARPDAHRLFAAHCAAEYPVRVTNETTGRTVMEWQERPGKPPNHLWDCLVGSAVAAGVEGLVWSSGAAAGSPTVPASARPRMSLKDQRARMAARRREAAPR